MKHAIVKLGSLLLAGLALYLCVLRLWNPVSHTVKSTQPVSQIVSLETILNKDAPFTLLRQVNFVGTQIVVLRHQATAQRVIIMRNSPGANASSVDIFFSQPLSPWTLQLLLSLLKTHSKFENSSLHVERSRLIHSGQWTSPKFQVADKRYIVDVTIDKKLVVYEAYLARLQPITVSKLPLLVMMINVRHAIPPKALNDFLNFYHS